MRSSTVIVMLVLLVATKSTRVHAQGSSSDSFWRSGAVKHGTGTATVTSNSPRPLWIALTTMEREYGWVIDFDDPIFGESETVPDHNPRWEARHPGVLSRAPAGAMFQSTYVEDAAIASSAAKVIEKVVEDYNKSDNPGRFEVRIEGAGHIEVVGHPRDPNAPFSDILATPITVAAGTRGSLDALSDLAGVLSSISGVKVVLGTLPFNFLIQAHVVITPGKLPARELLTQIADSSSVQLMWDFLYDYDTHTYFVSLRPRTKIGADGAINIVLPPLMQKKSQ